MPRSKKRRRGRPRHDNCARTPSGQKSRAKVDINMDLVAKEARQRVYGLTEDDVAHQDAGTVLGRLWLQKRITREQCDAGERYYEKYIAMRRAVEAPKGLEKSGRPGTPPDWDSPDFDRDAYTERAIRAVADYEVLRCALADEGLQHVVDVVAILDDEPATDAALQMLVQGLDLLAVKLGFGSKPGVLPSGSVRQHGRGVSKPAHRLAGDY